MISMCTHVSAPSGGRVAVLTNCTRVLTSEQRTVAPRDGTSDSEVEEAAGAGRRPPDGRAGRRRGAHRLPVGAHRGGLGRIAVRLAAAAGEPRRRRASRSSSRPTTRRRSSATRSRRWPTSTTHASATASTSSPTTAPTAPSRSPRRAAPRSTSTSVRCAARVRRCNGRSRRGSMPPTSSSSSTPTRSSTRGSSPRSTAGSPPGRRPCKGQYRVRDPGASTGAGLRAAALALRHHLRPLGRTTLGASSGLYGNGMAFRADVLRRRTWTDHLTEDIELQMELLLDGTLVAYAPDAVVEAEMPSTLDGARDAERALGAWAPRPRPALRAAAGPAGRRRTAPAGRGRRRGPRPPRPAAVGARRGDRWRGRRRHGGRPAPWHGLAVVGLAARRRARRPRRVRARARPGAAGRVPLARPRSGDGLVEGAPVAADARATGRGGVGPHAAGGRRRGDRRDDRTTRTVVLLGTPIDDVTLDEAVERIAEMVAVGRATGRAHQVATVNVDFVVNASHDAAVLEIMQRHRPGDPRRHGRRVGRPAVGAPIRERTSGVDLVPALVERAAREGWRICSSAPHPASPTRAASLLGADHPDGVVVGLEAPRSGPTARWTRPPSTPHRAAPGHRRRRPRQPEAGALDRPPRRGHGRAVLHRHRRHARLPHRRDAAGAGVDAASGLEWIHRAASEPRRLAGRYAQDLVVFGPALLRQAGPGAAGRRRRCRSTSTTTAASSAAPDRAGAVGAARPAGVHGRRRRAADRRSTSPPSTTSTTSRAAAIAGLVRRGARRVGGDGHRAPPNCRFEIGPDRADLEDGADRAPPDRRVADQPDERGTLSRRGGESSSGHRGAPQPDARPVNAETSSEPEGLTRRVMLNVLEAFFRARGCTCCRSS